MDITKGLNPKQKEAVQSITGPTMIVAGAGSGKTRVITMRIIHLLQQGIPASHILALTFSNKAAQEMNERVAAIWKDTQPMISTFHSLGYYLISRFASHLSLPQKITIYNSNDQIQLIKELLQKKSYRQLFTNAKNEISPYTQHQHISLLKNNLLPEVHLNEDIKALREEYDEALRAYHALDFDDLILYPIALLKNHPEVKETLHTQFQYFLVDEFQDTSTLQFDIIEMLSQHTHNICVVGDDDQSIYSWRGADLENWNRFAQVFKSHKEIILDTSYRCSPVILQAANAIIASSERHRDKQLQSHSLSHPHNDPIHVIALQDEHSEADYVSDMASMYHYTHDIPWSEIGILTRTNNLFQAFEVSLGQLQIPYSVSGGSSFFDHSEVKDLISYLRVCQNHHDDVSCKRIINSPKRGVGINSINSITQYATQHRMSFFRACQESYHKDEISLPNATRTNCHDFSQLIQEVSAKIAQGEWLSDCLKTIVTHTEFLYAIRKNYIDTPKVADWKEENVSRLIEIIEGMDKQGMNAQDILNAISYRMFNDIQDKDETLSLMTIHSAKGLEKQVIFVVGMENGIIPHKRSIEEDPAQIHEETRLCYVAVTRAKQYLHLTRSHTRKNKRTQKIQQQLPSPYLSCIPEDIITRELPVNNPEDTYKELDKFYEILKK